MAKSAANAKVAKGAAGKTIAGGGAKPVKSVQGNPVGKGALSGIGGRTTVSVSGNPVGKVPSGTPAPTGTDGGPTTVTTPVSPFLTAAQQQQYDADYQAYLQNRSADETSLNNATPTEVANEAQQQHNSAVAQANANALAAARGIFSSGINTGDLADINATLSQNLQTLRTNLASTVAELNGKIGMLDTGWNTEQADYKSLAAENAAGQDPVTTTVPATPAPAPAPAPAPTPAPQPKPTSKGITVPGAITTTRRTASVANNPIGKNPNPTNKRLAMGAADSILAGSPLRANVPKF